MSAEEDRATLLRSHRELLRLQRKLPVGERQLLETLMHHAFSEHAPEKMPILERGARVREGIRKRKIVGGK